MSACLILSGRISAISDEVSSAWSLWRQSRTSEVSSTESLRVIHHIMVVQGVSTTRVRLLSAELSKRLLRLIEVVSRVVVVHVSTWVHLRSTLTWFHHSQDLREALTVL